MNAQNLGKLVLIIGIILVVFGLVLMYIKKVPLIGRLPGDIIIRKENFTFYFPITSSIIISLIISLIVYLLKRR
ncbi:DUF2905 family protein [candidate division KSB1 bacterium]|nr:DUF2905 family protein [candidate division KSB1 bacterium]